MSVRIISQVWKLSKLQGGALLVLLAIADFANDEGMAYPSISTLAQKARLSKRHSQRILRGLVRAKVGLSSFYLYRNAQKLPGAYRAGRALRWDLEELRAWMRDQTTQSSSFSKETL